MSNSWTDKLADGRAVRNEKIEFTRRYYGYLEDKFPVMSQIEKDHRITVNMIFSNVSTLIPMIYFKDPHVSVVPKKSVTKVGVDSPGLEYLPDYELMERVANHKIGELRYFYTERMIALDTYLMGTGVSKVGYSRIFDKDEVHGESYLVEDDLWIQRASPFRIIPDPLAVDEHCARWIAEEIYMPFSEVEKKYGKRKFFHNLNPTHRYNAGDNSYNKITSYAGAADSLSVLVIHEVWDKVNKKVLVLADGMEDDPLEEMDWPIDSFEGYPYEFLRFHPHPECFWGLPPIRPYEAQQLEMNFMRSKIASLHGRASRKYLYREGAFDLGELDKIERGDDGAMVAVKSNIDQAFKPIQDPVFNSDGLAYNNLIKEDLNFISGIDDSARGQTTQSRTTATEIHRLQASLEIRTDDKRTLLEKHMKYTLKKALNLLVDNMTGTQTINYYDEERERPVVVAFQSEDIKGNYDVDIEIGSSAAPNKEVRQKLLIDMYQLVSQSPNINRKELDRQVLKAFDLDKSNLLIDAPPMAAPGMEGAPGQQGPQADQLAGAQESQAGETTDAAIMRALGGQTMGG